VSRLAVQQQDSLNLLIAQQEAARLKLREEFQRQQQQLMAEIYSQFPQLKAASTREHQGGRLEEVEVGLEQSIKEISKQDKVEVGLEQSIKEITKQDKVVVGLERSIRETRQDSVVPEPPEDNDENDMSVSSDISQSECEGENKENIDVANSSPSLTRRGTFTKRDVARPQIAVKIPDSALLARHQRGWLRLTALARGHLTRALLRTEKVEGLKRTIRETVACAVQLHSESGGSPPSKEDLQLHSRLLAQIEAACQALHDIFFRLDTAQRMAILSLDRRAARERMVRSLSGNIGAKKRLSAATEARLKAKANSPKLESWDEKRQRVMKNARNISIQTGKVLTNSNQKALTARSKSSPRIVRKVNSRKSKPILSTKLRQSALLNLDSPYLKREKPVWK